MIRARFHVSKKECGNDYRPVKWPISHPYWCSGESRKDFIIVAFADGIEEIKELWPEAKNIETEKVDKITFTGRFPCPKWYTQNDEGDEK